MIPTLTLKFNHFTTCALVFNTLYSDSSDDNGYLLVTHSAFTAPFPNNKIISLFPHILSI